MENRKGKVYIIGAGPGDPDLISVKGLKALKKADCVLYDFLSAPELLKHVKRSCEKICVGKKDGLHLKSQTKINRLLYEKSLLHANTVRLKGGDPFTFGRGFEEAEYLSMKDVDFEVIPGITSAIAAPESFGVPLTVKNRVSSVAIVAGRKKDINAEIEVPPCGTLIYLMAVANIARVVKALRASGKNENTPCAFIEKATRKDERIVWATIGTIEEKTEKAGIKPPAVLIVGETVKQMRKARQDDANSPA
ncbi:MAG: uroporphyrinogen-III C-methyltransferase [Candidatus Omnitrophota bacterium]